MEIPDAYLFTLRLRAWHEVPTDAPGFVLQLASDNARKAFVDKVNGLWYLGEADLDNALDQCDALGMVVSILGIVNVPVSREAG